MAFLLAGMGFGHPLGRQQDQRPQVKIMMFGHLRSDDANQMLLQLLCRVATAPQGPKRAAGDLMHHHQSRGAAGFSSPVPCNSRGNLAGKNNRATGLKRRITGLNRQFDVFRTVVDAPQDHHIIQPPDNDQTRATETAQIPSAQPVARFSGQLCMELLLG